MISNVHALCEFFVLYISTFCVFCVSIVLEWCFFEVHNWYSGGVLYIDCGTLQLDDLDDFFTYFFFNY